MCKPGGRNQEAGSGLRSHCSEPCRVPTAGTVIALDLTILHRAKVPIRDAIVTLVSQAVWPRGQCPGPPYVSLKHDPSALTKCMIHQVICMGCMIHHAWCMIHQVICMGTYYRAVLFLKWNRLGLYLLIHITAAPRSQDQRASNP